VLNCIFVAVLSFKVWSAFKWTLKIGVLSPPALANVLSPLKKVVASLVPVADNWFNPTVPSAGVLISPVPKCLTKLQVDELGTATPKLIVEPDTVKLPACVTPSILTIS